MFKKNKQSNQAQIKELEMNKRLEIAELKKSYELALKDKEFELKHFKDDEIKKLNENVVGKSQTIAVLQKENEMLGKITNLNADIIDIKDLVNKLIDKLPEIKLSNLTLQNGNQQSNKGN